MKKETTALNTNSPAPEHSACANIYAPSTYVTPDKVEAYDNFKARQKQSGKGYKCLGFTITPEDDRRMRAAIRGSILFFAGYGKGKMPLLNGGYFAPDELPTPKHKGPWLIHAQAVAYCGCTEERFMDEVLAGRIERRIYARNGNHVYYEYPCTDLDKFIAEQHLL